MKYFLSINQNFYLSKQYYSEFYSQNIFNLDASWWVLVMFNISKTLLTQKIFRE